MQLQKLKRDVINSTPMIEGETAQEYIDRTYHLALMAWENVPEADKQPDSEAEPLAKGSVDVTGDLPAETEEIVTEPPTETKEAVPSQDHSPQATTSLAQ